MPLHDYTFSDDPEWRGKTSERTASEGAVYWRESAYVWWVTHGAAAALAVGLALAECAWPTRYMKRMRMLKSWTGRGVGYLLLGVLTLVDAEQAWFFPYVFWTAAAAGGLGVVYVLADVGLFPCLVWARLYKPRGAAERPAGRDRANLGLPPGW